MRKGENIFKRKDGRWEARYIKGYELSGAFVSSFLDGITAILQSRVQKGKWVTNDSVHNCGNCKRRFSISRRKQWAFSPSLTISHCRWCGRVFCGDCSRHRVSWAFLGRNQRLCDNCYCVYVNLPLSLHELFPSH